jgi:ATP:corrinoid adenosyltransferase
METLKRKCWHGAVGKKRRRRSTTALEPAPPQLNAEQRAFTDASLSESLSLIAGAGSGKTTTIVQRILRLLQAGFSVLVFSHANKTVDEIRGRLSAYDVDVDILTMHKYCISRMHKAKIKVPYSMDAVMQEAALAFEEGRLDAFQSHIIVDEANDLSLEQNRIVDALWSGGHHVTLVGDMMQSIYGFHGSSPRFFKSFEEQLRPECRFQLRTNFRSMNLRLVDLANAIACDDIDDGVAVHMQPSPGSVMGAKPELLFFRGAQELHDACLTHIKDIKSSDGGRAASIMVLAHDNFMLGALHHHLMAHGVAAVLHSSQRSQEFRRIPERLRRGGVVQLLTIHGAKGGEADHVLLLSGKDRGDDKEQQGDLGSESRRLLYVACTRAKSTLKIFYGDSQAAKVGAQPCRWLSSAWDLIAAGGARKFSSSGASGVREGKVGLYVTELMKENGGEGLYDHFAALGADDPASFFCDEILDLEDTDDGGECIAKQAPKAYELGLEKFMGQLFENHAMNIFDRSGLTRLAGRLIARIARVQVNADVWTFFEAPEGKIWWNLQGQKVLWHLYQECLGASHTESGEIYEALPRCVQSHFTHALNSITFKYNGFEPVKNYFCSLVFMEHRRLLTTRSAPPGFHVFFRQHYAGWDGGEAFLLRPMLSAAFEAAVAVAEGSAEAKDLCLFTALNLCWEPEIKQRDVPEAWQPLLHLAQSPKSQVHLSPEDLMLSPKAHAQIQHDGARVVALLGTVQGLQTPNRVAFECRSEYGDLALSARGTVDGRCDVMFTQGPLEIKAVKMSLRAEHAAQALWYCCAAAAEHAYLWDVYRRRLLVWNGPERPADYLQACILAYLKYNAPPGGAGRVWPQKIRLLP